MTFAHQVVPKAHRGDPALEQLVHEPRREKGKEVRTQ